MTNGERPRCAICGQSIPRRAYQNDKTVRACCIEHANALYKLEHPTIPDRRSRSYTEKN